MKPLLLATLPFTIVLASVVSLHAAQGAFTIEKTPSGGLEVKTGGKPFATYVIDQANKPFLWPVYGPTGKPMTRAYPQADLPAEPAKWRDHPHHRGIVFGHESIGIDPWKFPEKFDGLTGAEKHSGGGDTWHEKLTFEEMIREGGKNVQRGKARSVMVATIRHREFVKAEAGPESAVIVELCDYVDQAGKRFLAEERRITFRVTGDTRLIDFDQDFTATDGEVRFDDRKDAGLSIRVPVTMAVDSKEGGRIVNADGVTDKDAWGKHAAWCDYHGPVEGEHLGVAMLNHPSSFRHPTGWHVRTYGLFTANPFTNFGQGGDGAFVLKPGGELKLRHRFVLHKGDEKTGRIAEAYAAYAAEKK